MKKGKVTDNVLKRSVLKYCHIKTEDTGKGAGSEKNCAFLRYTCGQDCERVPFGEELAVSTQTMVLPVKDPGSFAVLAAVNDLAAAGVRAFAAALAVTLPEDAQEERLKELMSQTGGTCRRLGVKIIGGHTEVTDQISAPIVTATALGSPFGGRHYEMNRMLRESDSEPVGLQDKKGIQSGLDIVMTKWIGLEGTVILAEEREKELAARYPSTLIAGAREFGKYLSVVPEAAAAVKSGVYAMRDIRNGGVFAALWELGRDMGAGLSVDLRKIPVKQETIEICEFFDLNPYELLSGGSLLLAVKGGEELVSELETEGISAEVIGRTTQGNDRIITNGEETRYLEPAKLDEILKVIH